MPHCLFIGIFAHNFLRESMPDNEKLSSTQRENAIVMIEATGEMQKATVTQIYRKGSEEKRGVANKVYINALCLIRR